MAENKISNYSMVSFKEGIKKEMGNNIIKIKKDIITGLNNNGINLNILLKGIKYKPEGNICHSSKRKLR